MPTNYRLSNVRTLLTEGFTAVELRRLCYDISDFRPVFDQLAENTGKTEIVDRLLEYADRKLLFEPLLIWAREVNPGQYDKYYPYVDIPSSPPSPLTPISTAPAMPTPLFRSNVTWSGATIGGLIGMSVSIIFGGGCALILLTATAAMGAGPSPISLVFPFTMSISWLITGLLAGWLGERRVLHGTEGESSLSLLARGAIIGLVAAGVTWSIILGLSYFFEQGIEILD